MTAPGGAYAAFRPELHPRDSHGRFRDKWGLPAAAKKLVDGIVSTFKPMTGSSDQDLEAKLGVHAGKSKRTPKQKAALDRFTSNGFAPVQADLRAKKPNADAAEMQSMLEPLPEDMLLTRVVGPEAFGLPPQRIGEVEEWTGKLVADKGFAPTNVGTPFQVGTPHVTMSIMTPKGTPAIIPGGSREVILGPDQPLRIVKVDSDGRGGVYVYAVAQPSGRTRALGRGMRASEKAPAIEATPEELKKRGLQEPSPSVPGVQPAPGATPSASAPESTPQAPDVNAPEAAAPDAKVADREAKVAEREAKVAEREAQVAELRGAKKAGKKAAKPEPNALEQLPLDQADDKLNADQIQRWRDATGDDAKLPQLHETMLAMTAEQLRKKEISREDAVKQLEDLARDRHTPADDFLRKVATIVGVGPEGKKVRAPRKKAEPGAVKKVPAKKAGNLAEDVNARFPAKKAAPPKKAAPKAATPAPVKKAETPPVKKAATPAPEARKVATPVGRPRPVKKTPPEVSTVGGRSIKVGDQVITGGKANRGQHGRTEWTVVGINEDGTVRLRSNFIVAGRPTRTRNSADPKTLSHIEVEKAATPAPEAPPRGRHAAPSAPSAPKLSTKEQALEDRRKQRQAARDRQQQIAHANGIAVVLAEVTELERKIADPKVMADHVRAIAKGPHIEEIRDVDVREALVRDLNAAADELEAGKVTHGRDLIDNLARKYDVELVDESTGLVDFNPDEHEALGGTIPAGAKVKIVRPGAILHRGGQVQLFKAKVALPKRPATARPEDIPELRDLRDMDIDQIRDVARAHRIKTEDAFGRIPKDNLIAMLDVRRIAKKRPAGPRIEDLPELGDLRKMPFEEIQDLARAHKMDTEDVFGRIPKADLIAMLDGRRIAKEFIEDLDPDRKWKRVELEAMNVPRLKELLKAHGQVPGPRMRKIDLVEALFGRLVNEPGMRNKTPAGAGGFADLDIKELKAIADRHDIGVGFNPARAQIIRRLIDKGVEDPATPLSEKSIKSLKIAVEDLGLVVPPNATKEELISILENPPKIDYHQEVPARLKKLIASVASGIKRLNPISDGAMGDTAKAELEDGGEAIRKSHKMVFNQPPRRQADAEQLASVLAEAVKAPTPAVYRQDGRTIFMEFVVGKQAAAAGSARRAKALDTPDAKLIGLLDALVGNGDRHDGNWMITPGGKPVGIDHGLAWSVAFNVHTSDIVHRRNGRREMLPGPARGRFVEHFVDNSDVGNGQWQEKIQFSRKELEAIRERMLKLRPQFELLGRGDWLEVSLERLDAIIRRAALP